MDNIGAMMCWEWLDRLPWKRETPIVVPDDPKLDGDIVVSVRVTREHILKGQPGITRQCPIALALKELGFDAPSVGATNIRFTDLRDPAAPKRYEARIVPEVFKWTVRYDGDLMKRARPLEFTIRAREL